jgi:hypothetical protein
MRMLTGGFSCTVAASTFDYAGGSAGRTVGSRRAAAQANWSTQSTRAFAARSAANVQDMMQAKLTKALNHSCPKNFRFAVIVA